MRKITVFFHKRAVAVALIVFLSLSVIVAGTYAWFSLAQNVTNEFSYEPYDIRLIKYEQGTDRTLAGAVFDLYDNVGNPVLSGLATDENGEIVLTGLDKDKQYYFIEKHAPYGYEIIGSGKTELISPTGRDVTVYNKRLPSSLTISKTIGAKDLNGDDYEKTATDTSLEFEFTVVIGTDTSISYNYSVRAANGNVTTQGSIKSGEKIALKDGELADFYDVPSLTYYSVVEDDYFVRDINPASLTSFGCETDVNNGHDNVIGYGSGWASYGNHTFGNIHEGSSAAIFENIHVPDGFEITMSSLVVVDRIIAHADDIDPQKAFKVTVTIGDDTDTDRQYPYEIVHIEDTMNILDNYDHKFAYYQRNDPTPEYGIGKDQNAVWPANRVNSTSLLSKLMARGVSGSYAANPPYHMPVENERWVNKDGNYQKLETSDGNTIVVNLHHSSAIIVYGIPTGTRYTVEQVDYRFIDGYIIDSTIKTAGTVIPDLDKHPDNDEYTVDDKYLRIRADIYNYFVLPIRNTIKLQKKWEHGDNLLQNWPASTTIDVIDADSHIVFDSRNLNSINDWTDSFVVPKYDDDGDLIDLGFAEHLPPDYVISDIQETEDGFVITNTYAPNAVKPGIYKKVKGYPPYDDEFVFEIRALTAGAPMPTNKTIKKYGQGYAFFDNIVFDRTGVYEYEIFERNSGSGYTYDSSVYKLIVTVTEDANGKLIIDREYQKDGKTIPNTQLRFTNIYDNTEFANLIVRKNVIGEGANKDKLFTFLAEIGDRLIIFTLKDGENKIFTDIPVGTPYTITELDYWEDGYLTHATRSSGTMPSGGTTALFTNIKTDIDGISTLRIEKKVEGDNADPLKMFRFTVTIGDEKHLIFLAHGETYEFADLPVGTQYSVVEDTYQGYSTTSEGASGSILPDGTTAVFVNRYDGEPEMSTLTVTKTAQNSGGQRFNFTATLGDTKYNITLSDGESYTFIDVPAGTSYSVTEDDYSSHGYVTSSANSAGTVTRDGSTAAFTNDKGAMEGVGDLTVSKKVTGRFLDATKKFRFSVVIGETKHEIFLRHGESYTFSDIPAGTRYLVTEDDYSSQDYVTSSSGASGTMTNAGAKADFINEYTGGSPPPPDGDAVQISGKKTWVHGGNTNKPQSITVYVMNGDAIAAQKKVTASDDWSYAFNLLKYDDAGQEIKYTVSEDAVKGYTKTIKGYDITNTYVGTGPKTGDERVVWIWFFVLMLASIGLRIVVFYRKRRGNK